eukprot:6478160-Amphidinium_carterae.2
MARLAGIANSLNQEKSQALALLEKVEQEAAKKHERELAAQKAALTNSISTLQTAPEGAVGVNSKFTREHCEENPLNQAGVYATHVVEEMCWFRWGCNLQNEHGASESSWLRMATKKAGCVVMSPRKRARAAEKARETRRVKAEDRQRSEALDASGDACHSLALQTEREYVKEEVDKMSREDLCCLASLMRSGSFVKLLHPTIAENQIAPEGCGKLFLMKGGVASRIF